MQTWLSYCMYVCFNCYLTFDTKSVDSYLILFQINYLCCMLDHEDYRFFAFFRSLLISWEFHFWRQAPRMQRMWNRPSWRWRLRSRTASVRCRQGQRTSLVWRSMLARRSSRTRVAAVETDNSGSGGVARNIQWNLRWELWVSLSRSYISLCLRFCLVAFVEVAYDRPTDQQRPNWHGR